MKGNENFGNLSVRALDTDVNGWSRGELANGNVNIERLIEVHLRWRKFIVGRLESTCKNDIVLVLTLVHGFVVWTSNGNIDDKYVCLRGESTHRCEAERRQTRRLGSFRQPESLTGQEIRAECLL